MIDSYWKLCIDGTPLPFRPRFLGYLEAESEKEDFYLAEIRDFFWENDDWKRQIDRERGNCQQSEGLEPYGLHSFSQ